jgi:hypothetical protein
MKYLALLAIFTLAFAAWASGDTGTPEPPLVAVEGAPQMNPAPTTCGPLPEAINFGEDVGRLVAAWPLYIGIENGVLPMPTTHYFTDDRLPGWWRNKVGWLAKASYQGTIHLRGANVDDGSPMVFEFNGDEPVLEAVLDSAHPGGFIDGLEGWAFFPSAVWVSKAGCYRLQVEWDGGRWEQVLAVGANPSRP